MKKLSSYLLVLLLAFACGKEITDVRKDDSSEKPDTTMVEPVIDPYASEDGFIDLGLSVEWASCNLGADTLTAPGFHISWGEKESKTLYSWETYAFSRAKPQSGGSSLEEYVWTDVKGSLIPDMTKYTSSANAVLESDDDCCRVLLGEGWRMPTASEWKELVENCSYSWISIDGIPGCSFTSKTTGKAIFLPAAGCRDAEELCDVADKGYYWSSTLSPGSSDLAGAFTFKPTGSDLGHEPRFEGLSIRPVHTATVPVTGIAMSLERAVLLSGKSLRLSAVVSPGNASDKTLGWASSDSKIAEVDQYGNVSAKAGGKAVISARSASGEVVGECEVTVVGEEPEAVDLGLSVKWAGMNLGALEPGDYGIRFAWGETSGKDICGWDNYSFGRMGALGRYNNPARQNTLLLEDDAAQSMLKGRWRIPTSAEWRELLKFCTWTRTTAGGVNGFKVTSTVHGFEGNSIFLPFAGCTENSEERFTGSQGYYWSSTLGSTDVNCAGTLLISEGKTAMMLCKRCFGHSIRPVQDSGTPSDSTPGGSVYGKVTNLGEPVCGVVVSDGVICTKTDAEGRYELPSEKKNGLVFISVPSGYTVSHSYTRPLFWYPLKERADIPERIDFSLFRDPGQDSHTCFLCGDIHIFSEESLKEFSGKFARHITDIVPAYSGRSPFAVTCGDMTWDWFWYNDGPGYRIPTFQQQLRNVKGIPVFYTVGNHDHDMKDPSGKWFNSADEINRTGEDFTVEIPYRELCGPTCYSHNVGKIHYISMDDVFTIDAGDGVKANRGNRIGFNHYDKQWLENDLSYVSKDTPIVLTMHIPFTGSTPYKWNGSSLVTTSREDMLSPLAGFSKVLIVSAHTHKLTNYQDRSLSNGIKYEEWTTGAVCGNFWSSSSAGLNLCADGTPGGFRVMDVDGTNIKSYYQATDHKGFHPFRAYDRNMIDLSGTSVSGIGNYGKSSENYVYINIWDWKNGWSLSVSEEGRTLSYTRITEYDPLYLLFLSENPSGADPATTNRIFRVKASSATSTLTIKVTDEYGNSRSETMKRPKAFTMNTYINENPYLQ